jgi:hypothetical protein
VHFQLFTLQLSTHQRFPHQALGVANGDGASTERRHQ